MNKFILVILATLLVSCSSDDICSAVPKLMAKGIASYGGCNEYMVSKDLLKVARKLPACSGLVKGLLAEQEEVDYNPVCRVGSVLLRSVDAAAILLWECKEGFNLEEALKAVVPGCRE